MTSVFFTLFKFRAKLFCFDIDKKCCKRKEKKRIDKKQKGQKDEKAEKAKCEKAKSWRLVGCVIPWPWGRSVRRV